MQQPKHDWNNLRAYAKGDLGRVWADLRSDDQQELEGFGLTDPELLEAALLKLNAKMLTWDTNEGPVSVIGSTPTGDPLVGLVWSLTANSAVPRWRWHVRHIEGILRELGKDYHILSNQKDVRNKSQTKWLKRIGFTFLAPRKDANGLIYQEFLRIMK